MEIQRKPHFYKAVFVGLLCLAMPAIVFPQSTDGWSLEAPPGSVQLTSVEQGMMANVVRFTFTNVSGKTILALLIDTRHGNMTGLEGFTNWKQTVAPGATAFVNFSTPQLSYAEEGPKKLYVAAIVYTNGSGSGSPKTLHMVEDEMLGTALETKRISGILLNSPDPTIAGFDNVLTQIGSNLPKTDYDAVQSLKGIALPGVSQEYIDEHLAHPEFGLKTGINRAREGILMDIKNLTDFDAREIKGNTAAQRRALESRPHALSDFAKKYSSLSDLQARYIEAIAAGEKGGIKIGQRAN